MSTVDVTWICCPDGIESGELRLSVVAAPALRPKGTLEDFAPLRDWPAVVSSIQWVVAFDPGTTETPATVAGDAPDSVLWRSVFPRSTPVRPFGSATDRTNLPVVTYPAAEVASTVRDAYAAAAQADGSEPTTDASRFLEPDFDLSPLDELRSTFAARLTEAHASIEARDPSDRALVEVVATRRGANSAVARAYAMQQPAPVASPENTRRWTSTRSRRCSETTQSCFAAWASSSTFAFLRQSSGTR